MCVVLSAMPSTREIFEVKSPDSRLGLICIAVPWDWAVGREGAGRLVDWRRD
jgi:hypothetical protein